MFLDICAWTSGIVPVYDPDVLPEHSLYGEADGDEEEEAGAEAEEQAVGARIPLVDGAGDEIDGHKVEHKLHA